jgi:hypothetical protein
VVAATLVAGCNAVYAVGDLDFEGTISSPSSSAASGGGGSDAGCHDGERGGDETGIDCGGPCPPCMGDRPLGAACTDASQCQSGQCPEDDGICCDSPCALICEACTSDKTGVADGVCDFVKGGTDPDAECLATEPWRCGTSGMGCSGNLTACALWPAGTSCGTPFCAGGSEYGGSSCDGMGDCDTPPGTSCTPYVCGASSCLTSCGVQSDCVATHYCESGNTCVPKLPTGSPCSADAADFECQCGDCTSLLFCCA